VWLPLTVKLPLLPLTTPVEVLPSPQVMTAVYAAAPSIWSGVVKVAPCRGSLRYPLAALAARRARGLAPTVGRRRGDPGQGPRRQIGPGRVEPLGLRAAGVSRPKRRR
jgi:hypothetical protein